MAEPIPGKGLRAEAFRVLLTQPSQVGGEVAVRTPGKVDGGVPVGPRPIGVERLLASPVPDIPQAQLARYDRKSLQMRKVREVGPGQPAEAARTVADGTIVLKFDIGGDKIAAGGSVTENGTLVDKGSAQPFQSQDGVGYLDYMEAFAEATDGGRGLVIGTSFAGPVDGTRPIVGTNVRTFKRELDEKYGGDMANIFPNAETVAGGNDGETGTVEAVAQAFAEHPEVNKVIFVIHGGGYGGSVWERDKASGDKGSLDAAEPGHIPVVAELNPFNRTAACGQEGSPAPQLTCVEKIAGSGQGVEQTYYEQTGQRLTGIQISELYQAGDPLATRIYDAAARVVATGILGLDQATTEPGSNARALDEGTVIVAHGGLFKTPGIGERVEQILEEHLGYRPTVMYTKDFSDNASLDGAGKLALMEHAAKTGKTIQTRVEPTAIRPRGVGEQA
ncbi:MAG TPA: ROK family protein [Candidatus Acidoferrales bacterium]|nr:ROK family protein [Candidatus Acidoferrales bacterium]